MRDHREALLRLAQEHGWIRGVELGVGSGQLLHRLLAAGVNMIGVDLGRRADRRSRVEAIEKEFAASCRMLWLPTREAAPQVPDGWADFVFVDAAHSYEAVRDDLARWQAKVRPGGWFGGHDYHPMFPGVMRAVDEAFPGRVQILAHTIWTVRA